MNMNRRHFLVSMTTTGVCASTLQRPANAVTLPETNQARWGSQFTPQPSVTRQFAYRQDRLRTVAWQSGSVRIDLQQDGQGGVVLNTGHDTLLTRLDFQTGHAQHTLAAHVEPDLIEEIYRELELAG